MIGCAALDVTQLPARLQAIVDGNVATYADMPGHMLHVLTADRQVEVAAGMADRTTGEPLTPSRHFRIASVTKPFVAAATLRLVEQGRLELDARAEELLPHDELQVLRDGGYRPEGITLRHLLTHTSGIYDFAADAYDSSIPDGFIRTTQADPSRRWTRLEQIRFAMDHGKPRGEPGTVYHYSDTGACLVGEILERTTGMTMGAALRELCAFDRLGLTHTYHETIEPEPASMPPLAHQYEGEFDVAEYDASVDLWGGGGLISTCADLARFFRALLRGEVFDEPETLETMCTLTEGVEGVEDGAAMFLYRTDIAGETFWGHGGYWGTTAYTCPRLDVTVVSQIGQAHMPDAFDRMQPIAEALALLR